MTTRHAARGGLEVIRHLAWRPKQEAPVATEVATGAQRGRDWSAPGRPSYQLLPDWLKFVVESA